MHKSPDNHIEEDWENIKDPHRKADTNRLLWLKYYIHVEVILTRD